MDVKLAFGKALKQIRKKRGMTQEAFEPMVVRTYISSLERGIHSPTLERVSELAGILNVSSATLLMLTAMHADGTEDPEVFLESLGTEIRNWL